MTTPRILGVFLAVVALLAAGCNSPEKERQLPASLPAESTTAGSEAPAPAGREPSYPRARGIHVPGGYAAPGYARGPPPPTPMALGPHPPPSRTPNDRRGG